MASRKRIFRLMTPPLNAEQSAMVRMAHHKLAPLLSSGSSDATETLELPSQAWALISQMLAAMESCRAMLLVPDQSEYGIEDAADYLGVSEKFVIAEMDAGTLPFASRSDERVVRYPDLLRYEQDMVAARERALQDLADLSQELDPDH